MIVSTASPLPPAGSGLNSTAASNCDLCKLYWGLGTFQSGFQSLALSQLECDRIYRRSVNGSWPEITPSSPSFGPCKSLIFYKHIFTGPFDILSILRKVGEMSEDVSTLHRIFLYLLYSFKIMDLQLPIFHSLLKYTLFINHWVHTKAYEVVANILWIFFRHWDSE